MAGVRRCGPREENRACLRILGSDAYIVPRAQHELLELPVGEMGQVKALYGAGDGQDTVSRNWHCFRELARCEEAFRFPYYVLNRMVAASLGLRSAISSAKWGVLFGTAVDVLK